MRCAKCDVYCRSKSALDSHICEKKAQKFPKKHPRASSDSSDASSTSSSEGSISPSEKKYRKSNVKKHKDAPSEDSSTSMSSSESPEKRRKKSRHSLDSSSSEETARPSKRKRRTDTNARRTEESSESESTSSADGFTEDLDVLSHILPCCWRSLDSLKRAAKEWREEVDRKVEGQANNWVRKRTRHTMNMMVDLFEDNKRHIKHFHRPSPAAQRNFFAALELYVKVRGVEEAALENALGQLSSRVRRSRKILRTVRKLLQSATVTNNNHNNYNKRGSRFSRRPPIRPRPPPEAPRTPGQGQPKGNSKGT